MTSPYPQEMQQEIIDGLRNAVGRLYACRYSELALAEQLDAILKKATGQTYLEYVMAEFHHSAAIRQPD